jgi:hypothetical protein
LVFGFTKIAEYRDISPPFDRVRNPDVRNSKVSIVVHAFLHAMEGVFLGKHFDAD